MRDWRIATALGMPPSVADNESAVRLDWMLHIEAAYRAAEAEASRK